MALSRILKLQNAVHPRFITRNPKLWEQSMAASSFTIKSVESNKSKPLAGEVFEDKNKRLNRPISPHLGIYKFESNMAMSISHRITGFIQNGMLYGLAVGAMVLPGSFPYYLSMLNDAHLSPLIILAAKFLIAFPFSYHLVNGMRHLIWDCGYLITIKNVNVTGYLVLAVSLAMAAMLVNL